MRTAIHRAGIRTREVGIMEWHDDYSNLKEFRDAPMFTIVRNPYQWYASFWADRSRNGWGGNLVVGHEPCISDVFDEWVQLVCVHRPSFLARHLYPRFDVEGVHVMRTETLVNDLVSHLSSLGEDFDPEVLRGTSFENCSPNLPRITEQQALDIYNSEETVFAKYGYSFNSYRSK